MRTIIIVNRLAFDRQPFFYKRKLKRKLENISEVNLFFTDFAGHCPAIIKKHSNAEHIIVAGGDGTIHEAINTMNLKNQSLSIIPIGRGNSLARDLKIKANWIFKESLQPRSIKIPLFEINFIEKTNKPKKIFAFSTCGVGTVSHIVSRAGKHFKFMGALSYLPATFSLIKKHYAHALKISFNSHEVIEGKIFGTIVNNTKHCGPFKSFPESNWQTSDFETLTFIQPRNRNFLAMLTHKYKNKAFKRQITTSVLIEADQGIELMVDGEIIENVNQINFERSNTKLSLLR